MTKNLAPVTGLIDKLVVAYFFGPPCTLSVHCAPYRYGTNRNIHTDRIFIERAEQHRDVYVSFLALFPVCLFSMYAALCHTVAS